MNESDWNNDFDENFDEVLRSSVSSNPNNRFFNKSPVKETEDTVNDRFRNLSLNKKDGTKKKFMSVLDFNQMKREQSTLKSDDQYKTLSKDDYIDGFDEDEDQMTIKPGNFQRQQEPRKKKSLRFLRSYNDVESDLEDDIEFPQDFGSQISPSKRNHFYKSNRVNPENIQISTSPSRSTSSSVSLSNYSETSTEFTDNEDFTEGFELNNNINLLKQYQLRKERALHQAQIEYDTLMKYNSLLHRKVQSTNNIPRLRRVPNEEEEDFMDGFDQLNPSSFYRPKRPDPRGGKVKHSQSSYTLRGKHSMSSMRDPSSGSRKLKHSASNYFDVYRGANDYKNALSKLSDNYTVNNYGDGNELDDINDLSENQDETLTQQDKKSIRKLINLANYMEVYQNDKPKKSKQRNSASSSPKKQRSRKIGLIKQLSSANSEKVYYNNKGGDMKYNPQTYRWEGNDVDLTRFENPNSMNSLSKSNTLHTITKKLGGGQNYQIVGDMVFNPEKLCWMKIGQENVNAEEDPFKDVDDLEEEPVSRKISNDYKRAAAAPRGVSSSSLMTSSSVGDDHRLFDINEEDSSETDDPFKLSRELTYKFRHEELKWNKKVKNWFQPDESYDRDYLYEIRRMVTDNL